MARARDRLTARAVEAKRQPGLYLDGQGLHLRVTRAGTRSWIYRYRIAGRAHDLGLGPYPLISLADARERATAQRRLRLDGLDPLAARQAARAKSMTFRQCAEAYIDAHRAGWRNPKHAAQWPATLDTYVFPIFGDLAVAAVDTGLVTRAIEPIWATKPETAGRVRGRIEAVLDWAKARGYRDGENSARWKGHLDHLLPARSKVRRVEHHAALPYVEVGEFMAVLRGQDGVAARALEFLVLTAARTGEVIGARWREIDLGEKVWTVPGSRMKAGREHRVPLPARAVELLGQPGDLDARVFPLSNMALLMLLRRLGRGDLTAHGFRSTFSDWCAERTAFPAEVREIALAHAIGDKVEAAYRRGDLFQKRRQLAEAWARYCAAPATGGKVVAIRR